MSIIYLKESESCSLLLILYLKNSQLITIQVSHLEGLDLGHILGIAKRKINIDDYLLGFKKPEKNSDRSWTWNIGRWYMLYINDNSLILSKFKMFGMEAVSISEYQYSSKRKEEIDLLTEFAKLFQESTFYLFKFVCQSIEQEVIENLICYWTCQWKK